MGFSQTEYISQYLSDQMLVPTVMFWVAIAIAVTSVVCFFLAPIYSKGKHGGVKVLAQIITIIDFIGGIGSILVFVAASLLSLLTAAGAFADASLSAQENILGILVTPSRFGMPIEDLSVGTIILFYGLYFGIAGVLGIITFIVNSSARGKYNGINGKIRGAAAPQGVPQFAPYQPYGQNMQNMPQGYPHPYQQNAPQGYPQQYQQNAPQGYPQQYQQNAPQGYPQPYQQNAPQGYPQQNPQYQTTSGETTVLTPEMLEPQTVPVGSMNTQSVSFAQPAAEPTAPTEPVAEPTEPTVPTEPVAEPTEPTAPTEPVAEPTEPTASTEPVAEPTEPTVPTEPVAEPTEPTAPTESAAEPTEPTVSTEPVAEPTEPTAPTEPVAEPQETVSTAQSVPASFCVNCGNALAQGVAFCPNCGYRVNSAPTAFCTGCGAKLPDGAAFCTTCGKKADM